MNGYIKTGIGLLVVAGLASGAYIYYKKSSSSGQVSYKTATIQKGDLVSSISATGTLEPEELVDVGAQVTGQIVDFGKDAKGNPIDYVSYVDKGMVLAKIDEALYITALQQAEGQRKQAEASLAQSEASLLELNAKRELARCNMERAEKMHPNDIISKADYDSCRSAFDVAKAQIKVGEANILQARATLDQQSAACENARRNLGYCTIKSPVDGIVIDRRVNIGQTVVSSMSTSSLFLIAKDIRKMQIWVAVNEADIGQIRPEMPVSYTIDAFPGESFRGYVGKVRLNASMTQNVVTYTVEVVIDNSSGRLLPYLTANVVFEAQSLKGVLTVPNSALRWSPKSPAMVAPAFRSAMSESGTGEAEPDPAKDQKPLQSKEKDGTLWTHDSASGLLKPVKVKMGASDGAMTEVSGDPATVKEGLVVVVGQLSAEEIASATKNPFAPQFPKRRKGK